MAAKAPLASGTRRAAVCSHATRRYAVVGSGLAGTAVAYRLVVEHGGRASVDVFDPLGVAGGASGACSGLLHPLAPSGAPLWRGVEGCEETERMLEEADELAAADAGERAYRRTGAVRVAKHDEQAKKFREMWPGQTERRWSTRVVSIVELEDHLPGLHVADGVDCALYIPDALVVDAERYVSRLFLASQQIARQGGGSVKLVKAKVSSARSLAQDGHYDAVIIAAGAAIGSLTDIQVQSFDAWKRNVPLGSVACARIALELTRGDGVHVAPGLPCDSFASLLGSTYICMPVSPSRGVAIGATRKRLDGVTAIDPVDIRPTPRLELVADLIASAESRWPHLHGQMATHEVVSGVRASTPRTELGTIPVVARLPVDGAAIWILSAFGARGLVYHAMCARAVSAAVAYDGGNEDIDPAFRRFVR